MDFFFLQMVKAAKCRDFILNHSKIYENDQQF